jgi:hypothetical protein
VSFSTLPDGRTAHNGEAWVSFSSAAECARAFAERNRQHLGNRYIELFMQDRPWPAVDAGAAAGVGQQQVGGEAWSGMGYYTSGLGAQMRYGEHWSQWQGYGRQQGYGGAEGYAGYY